MNPDMPVHVQNLKLVDFDIIKPLGKGAYSEVFLAKNKFTGHESALKIVDKNFLLKEKKMHHAYIEREVLSKLRHQGIIKLFNSFEEHDKLFYSLEVLTDGNLQEYMNRHILNDSIIKFYVAELLLILEYLHQNGLVHRDVKPENILLTKDNHLKLIDFGTVFVYDHNKLISEINQKILGLNIKSKDLLLQTILRNPKLGIAVILVLWAHQNTYVLSQMITMLLDHRLICGHWDVSIINYNQNFKLFNQNEFELFNNISQCSWSQDSSIPNDALNLIKILLDKDPLKRFLGEFDGNFTYHQQILNIIMKVSNNTSSLEELVLNILECYFKISQELQKIKNKVFGLQMWLQDIPFINTTDQHKRKISRIQTTFIENNRALRDKYDNQGISQIIIQGQLDKEHGVLFMTQFSLRHASIVCQDRIVLFIYINPQLNNKKTVIPLNQFTSCKLLGKGKFIVADRNKKKYIFKQRENNVTAQQWVNLINKYIKSNHY